MFGLYFSLSSLVSLAKTIFGSNGDFMSSSIIYSYFFLSESNFFYANFFDFFCFCSCFSDLLTFGIFNFCWLSYFDCKIMLQSMSPKKFEITSKKSRLFSITNAPCKKYKRNNHLNIRSRAHFLQLSRLALIII
jgi:hypothetical protein